MEACPGPPDDMLISSKWGQERPVTVFSVQFQPQESASSPKPSSMTLQACSLLDPCGLGVHAVAVGVSECFSLRNTARIKHFSLSL